MPFIALAIGAGAGVLKSEFIDRPKEERQRKLAGATQRYSPWTGLKAQPIQEADPMGSAIGMGATGASMEVGLENAKAQNRLMDAQSNWLSKNPYNSSVGASSAMKPSPWRVNNNDYTFRSQFD